MNNNRYEKLVQEIISELDKLTFGFVGNNYYKVLKDTYVRTISDIERYANGKNLKILELGAFTGVVSIALARLGYAVTAHDIPLVMNNRELVNFFEKNGVNTIAFDLKDSPYPEADRSFDIIVACEILEHLPFNPIPVIQELKRLLADNGVCYIATPNQASLVHRYYLFKGKSFSNPIEHYFWALDPSSAMSVGLHWKEYTKSELLEFFGRNGLSLKEHYYCRYVSNPGSSLIRRRLVSLIYFFAPQLMQCQVGIFAKN